MFFKQKENDESWNNGFGQSNNEHHICYLIIEYVKIICKYCSFSQKTGKNKPELKTRK
jgi:coproporphyrinogen III oxidase-like Fe-S oxidoreductase